MTDGSKFHSWEVEEHVEGRGDLRELTEAREGRGWELARPERRVVHESTRKWGTVDTEDVHETSRVQDGHVVTETERTTQHEQYENESLPDSGSSLSDGSVHEEARETQHNIVHTKDEDLVEYYGVPRGGTLAQGVKLGEGMHVVSEDFHEDREGEDLDSLSERLRRARRLGSLKPKTRDTPERTDALTRRPLDYHQEEETRKSETNRWLENHFGSESGRSGSSSHHDPDDDGGAVHTSGGNVITITMSPRPATPQDERDDDHPPAAAAPGTAAATHRWRTSPVMASKAPPPPPPPKPSPAWTPPPPPTSTQPQQAPLADEITDTMIAAARARLRSTGRILDDSNQPASLPVTSDRFNSCQERVQVFPPSGGTYASPPVSPTGVTRPTDDPVFGSRFRSGSPGGYVPKRLLSSCSRTSRPAGQSPPDSPPPPLPATPPPPPQTTTVGRSQSFNVATKSWMNSGSRTSSRLLDSRMKEYRSEEQLDAVGQRPSRRWPPPQRDLSPEPAREPTPPPPPRHRTSISPPTNNIIHYNTAPTRSSRSSRTSDLATQTLARDSGTQTDPSPVPPPRTKRKHKPKTYYFGQDSLSSMSSSSRTRVANTTTSRDDHISPKVERRFRTTKTVTSVAMPVTTTTSGGGGHSNLKNRSWHYRSMDELSSGADSSTPRASWTNTVDPRRRPRHYTTQVKEPETKTLPKKLVNGTSPSPSKTYIFGDDNSSSRSHLVTSSSHLRRSQGGSMVNVSLAGMSSPKSSVAAEVRDQQSPPRTTKPVIRSHSLNVKAAPLTLATSPGAPPPTAALNTHQRTSTMYRSSPYLNLRSPNLIATIARSNSTRRTDEEQNGHPERPESPADRPRSSSSSSQQQQQPALNGHDAREEEKRAKFMKGLLTSAPELYHFIHGDDTDKGGEGVPAGTIPPESPPLLIRPPGSPVAATSPPPSTAPRIFTFGRGEVKRPTSLDNTSNNRFSGRPRDSLSSSHLDNGPSSLRDTTTTGTGGRNSLSSQYHRNALLKNTLNNGTTSLNRPKFNLKSPGGGSILYSTSFRSRTEPPPPAVASSTWGRRGSDSTEAPPRWRDQEDKAAGGKVSSNLSRDGPVLIPIRDWNSR